MHVVATAGHVDHGKSTLVRALTGMEPDRWAEERRRGMTIDLGFAWTTLPDGEQVAFVDVPGHQRFVPNMLAGVGPAPAAMLVVAADEGWRRQSGEHLAALAALGVAHGLLVVTRSDLADPAPALAEARAHLAGTPLAGVEEVAVSGATGAGLAELRAALQRLVASMPLPVTSGRVRFWVDRAFSVRGAGTVVTGTLGAGCVAVGDELVLAGSGRTVRVRGLETLKRSADEVAAVARLAVNLRGVSGDAVCRGDALVTPGRWLTTATVDVRLVDARPDAEKPAVAVGLAPVPDAVGADQPPPTLASSLVLHVGSAAVGVHVRPLPAGPAGDGGARLARLTLDRPLPLVPGDRALLRDPGEQRVVAGVVVLDADPPELRRRGAAAVRGRSLAAGPDPVTEVSRRGTGTRAELAARGVLAAEGPLPAGLLATGELVVAAADVMRWRDALVEAVDRHRAAAPLDAGLPLAAAARAVGLPDLRLLPAVVRGVRPPDRTQGPPPAALEVVDGRLRRPGTGADFPPAVAAALARLSERFADAPFEAPEQVDLTAAGLSPPVLAAAERSGLLLRVEPGLVLPPDAERRAVALLSALPQPFTAAQARTALQTTRRVAIPLLEHLDRRRLTRRVDGMLREVISRG